jgi:HEAT repeat protein
MIFQPLLAEDSLAENPPTENPPTAEVSAAKKLEDQRRDTMLFGTETEIASLIQTLKAEKITYLDEELIAIAQKTRNRSILAGIFGLFAEMEKSGLEERAIRAVRERDQEANDTVLAAVDYLGKVKSGDSLDCLMELINSGESRFLNNALRSLGRAAKGEEADNIAEFLLDYYKSGSHSDETKRELLVAIGETGSDAGGTFLAGMIKNTDERPVLRMAALDAISKIEHTEGLDAVIEAVSSSDPNVRSSAVAALAPFSGDSVDSAILEAFRDSYFRTRIGAAQAAGKRRLESAIPYLRYRAENDDVPNVKDEAIRALGAIGNSETIAILNTLFSERQNSDRVRIVAAEMLLLNDPENYGIRVFVEMEEAKSKNLTPLYNGFVRVMAAAKGASLEGLVRRFISIGGVVEKSLALDLVLNNEFRGLADDVRALLDDKVHSATIARKAMSTLEKLGLE